MDSAGGIFNSLKEQRGCSEEVERADEDRDIAPTLAQSDNGTPDSSNARYRHLK